MIELTDIRKNFGKREILKGVGLRVNEGETVTLIGSSGSGKSTLLRCINLLETPDSGTVTIGDFSFSAGHINKNTKLIARRKTAMVFQNFGLFANKTALGNVTEALKVVKKIHKDEADEIGREYLKRVGLLEQANQYPDTLSGGQKQRVAISRALALNPSIILFDEPTSALDPELVQEVQSVIKELADDKTTMLIVTHELRFAERVSNRVAFMSEGAILEYDTPDKIFSNPSHERIKSFLENYD